MCLAADVVMIESGSTGYNGQVDVVKLGVTECYDCNPKPVQKSYAVCTIRSTPEKQVHCVVWAKALFELVFGVPDDGNLLADLHVVPKAEDKEKEREDRGKEGLVNGVESRDKEVEDVKENGETTDKEDAEKPDSEMNGVTDIDDAMGTSEKPSSASRVRFCDDDTFESFADRVCWVIFHDDIEYQRGLDSLWSGERPAPTTATINTKSTKRVDLATLDLQSNEPWTLEKSCSVFLSAVLALAPTLAEKNPKYLTFDKDNRKALAFVVAAANIRAAAYSIKEGLLSPFKGKGIAGNIIHAVATTNAVVAGLVVLEALRIVSADLDVKKAGCMTTFVVRQPSGGSGQGKGRKRRSFVVNGQDVGKGKAGCQVCGGGTKGKGWRWKGDVGKWTLEMFLEKVVRGAMGISMPTVDCLGVGEGGGAIIYECGDDLDDEEMEMFKANEKKTLEELGVKTLGGALGLSDNVSDKQAIMYIEQKANNQDDDKDPKFEILGSWAAAPPTAPDTVRNDANTRVDKTKEGNDDMGIVIDADEVEFVEPEQTKVVPPTISGKKRPRSGEGEPAVENGRATKRTKDAKAS
eukprot:Plantae.Rhodophyta-Hildenbrandia_rubra.ctg16204.p1 GENE.Plantae.Rhodophyta-Hildenbrandia_rubra.ctg16204~~Plantae.Rhodophyta-Hildenbrandia_rubra.ctg16204.p1  ORF type:complete len:578 (+),score=157.10 Plantae.Rhodophyta-Hildenbrandia_rubra.ctg16204:436-2169(+)